MRVTLADVLMKSGKMRSMSKGRRLILQEAIKLNGQTMDKFDHLNTTIMPHDTIEVGGWTINAETIFSLLEQERKEEK